MKILFQFPAIVRVASLLVEIIFLAFRRRMRTGSHYRKTKIESYSVKYYSVESKIVSFFPYILLNSANHPHVISFYYLKNRSLLNVKCFTEIILGPFFRFMQVFPFYSLTISKRMYVLEWHK